MAVYVSSDEQAKKVKPMYIGDSTGTAKKVIIAYLGDKDGKAREFYKDENYAGIKRYKAAINYRATQITLTFNVDPGSLTMSHITIGGNYSSSWSISGTGTTRTLSLTSAVSNYGLTSGSATNTLTLKINYSNIDTKTITWTIVRNGNSVNYTANVTWSLPTNTGALYIQAIARGGNGGSGALSSYESSYARASGGGGSSGQYKDTGWTWVTPSSTPNLVMTGVASGSLVLTGAYSVTLSQGAVGGNATASTTDYYPTTINQIAGSAGVLSGAVSGGAGSVSSVTTTSGTVSGGGGGSWGTLAPNGNGGAGASVTTSVGSIGQGTGGKVRIYYTTWTITGGDA